MLRRHDDGAIVEEVLSKGNELGAEGLLRYQRAETRTIDEDVPFDAFAAFAEQCSYIAVCSKLYFVYTNRLVPYTQLYSPVAQECAKLVSVEMVAIARREGEILSGMRCFTCICERLGDEPVIGVGRYIDPPAGQHAVVQEARLAVQVGRRREGVEVACETGPLAPAGEADAELVCRITGRHPFGLLDAEMVEEGFELRRRSLTDADDADLGAFDNGHRSAACPPLVMEQGGGNPAGAAAAEDDDAGRGGSAHPPVGISLIAKPPPGAMRKSSTSADVTVRSSITISNRASPR